MKRSLFWLGAAAMALASCTNSEVMEMAENRAIGFSSFVNNNTRAVQEVTSGTLASSDFYVFGNYSTNGGTSWDGKSYQNETGDAQYYWVENSKFRFGAYANGKKGKLTTTDEVSFSAADNKLTFTGYTPDDACDLIAAVPAEIMLGQSVTSQNAVELNFKHMLAQVAFEFSTDAANIYELKITDLKINNAINTATGTFNGTDIVWAGSTVADGAYSYSEFDNVNLANDALKPTPRSYTQSKLVIPQELPTSSTMMTVTFTATLKDLNNPEAGVKTQDFTADLSYTDGDSTPSSDKWTAGYRYKYTTTITADMIDDSLQDKEIEFTATVTDWEDADNTPVTPNEVTP